jgi:two-component system chemotaxis response regulator CheB
LFEFTTLDDHRFIQVCVHRRSVAVLCRSFAKSTGDFVSSVLLTGVCQDGAERMLVLRKAGASVFVQNEAISALCGMPKRTFEKGATNRPLPLHKIADEVMVLVAENG